MRPKPPNQLETKRVELNQTASINQSFLRHASIDTDTPFFATRQTQQQKWKMACDPRRVRVANCGVAKIQHTTEFL